MALRRGECGWIGDALAAERFEFDGWSGFIPPVWFKRNRPWSDPPQRVRGVCRDRRDRESCVYRSWVIYSVAVYLGLLLAGALIGPPPSPTIGADRLPSIETPSIRPVRDPGFPEANTFDQQIKAASVSDRP